ATEISRLQVRSYLRAGVKRLTRDLIRALPSYRKAYDTITMEAGTNEYDFPDRFLAFRRIDVNFSSSASDSAHKVDIMEDEAEHYPDTAYQTNDPRVFIRGDQLVVEPAASIQTGGTIFCWGWSHPAEMDSDGDTHGLPHGAEELLISYA